MKTRYKQVSQRGGESAAEVDFHGERIAEEVQIKARNERANRPQGDYEYEQMIAENTVFSPKQMIAEAAFYIAERRDFAPGHELSDWLQAERDVEARLCSDN